MVDRNDFAAQLDALDKVGMESEDATTPRYMEAAPDGSYMRQIADWHQGLRAQKLDEAMKGSAAAESQPAPAPRKPKRFSEALPTVTVPNPFHQKPERGEAPLADDFSQFSPPQPEPGNGEGVSDFWSNPATAVRSIKSGLSVTMTPEDAYKEALHQYETTPAETKKALERYEAAKREFDEAVKSGSADQLDWTIGQSQRQLLGDKLDAAKSALDHAQKKQAVAEEMLRGERPLFTMQPWASYAETGMQSVVRHTAANPIKYAGIIGGYIAQGQNANAEADPYGNFPGSTAFTGSEGAGAKEAHDNAIYHLGETLDKWGKAQFPGDIARADEFGTKMADMAGFLVPIYGVQGVSKLIEKGPAALRAAAQAYGYTIASSAGGVPHYEAATEASHTYIGGFPDEGGQPAVSGSQKFGAFLAGSALGLLPAHGAARALGANTALAAGTEQAAAMAGFSLANDAIARGFYDPKKQIGENVTDDALLGFIFGHGAHLVKEMVTTKLSTPEERDAFYRALRGRVMGEWMRAHTSARGDQLALPAPGAPGGEAGASAATPPETPKPAPEAPGGPGGASAAPPAPETEAPKAAATETKPEAAGETLEDRHNKYRDAMRQALKQEMDAGRHRGTDPQKFERSIERDLKSWVDGSSNELGRINGEAAKILGVEPSIDGMGKYLRGDDLKEATKTPEAPKPIPTAPDKPATATNTPGEPVTFEQVKQILPRDADNYPDITKMNELIHERFGWSRPLPGGSTRKRTFADLTPDEKSALYDELWTGMKSPAAKEAGAEEPRPEQAEIDQAVANVHTAVDAIEASGKSIAEHLAETPHDHITKELTNALHEPGQSQEALTEKLAEFAAKTKEELEKIPAGRGGAVSPGEEGGGRSAGKSGGESGPGGNAATKLGAGAASGEPGAASHGSGVRERQDAGSGKQSGDRGGEGGVTRRRELGDQFTGILKHGTPRSEWGQRLRVGDDELKDLIQDKVDQGILRYDRNGIARRNPNAFKEEEAPEPVAESTEPATLEKPSGEAGNDNETSIGDRSAGLRGSEGEVPSGELPGLRGEAGGEGEPEIVSPQARGAGSGDGEPGNTPDVAPDTGEKPAGSRTGSGHAGDTGNGERAGEQRPDTEPTGVLSQDARKERDKARVETEQRRIDRSALNYKITEDDRIGQGGDKEKVRANIDAIKVLRLIEDEGRDATEAEKKILVRYVGWGAFAQAVFDTNTWTNNYKTWKKEREELRNLLTDAEYKSAVESTLNAHYTSFDVVSGIWDVMEHFGFDGGRALEPSAGIGHFIGVQPEAMRPDTAWTAVELDKLTAAILKQLYRGSDTRQGGFEDQKWPDNFFDLAVSNVPFGKYKIEDRAYGRPLRIHDYFFLRALDKVRPGGIVAFITSKGTLDKENRTVRRDMAKRATFLGAIRLPGGDKGAFAKNAGTAVTTDIIFLRKRLEGEPQGDQSWLDLKLIETPEGGAKINAYFADNPHMMLGEMRLMGTMHTAHEPVLIGSPDGLREKIAAAGKTLLEGAYIPKKKGVSPEKAEAADRELAPDHIKEGAFYLDNKGVLHRRVSGVGEPQKISKENLVKMKALMELRDIRKNLLATQKAGSDASAAHKRALRTQLGKAYNAFVKAYGPINKTIVTETKRLDKHGEPVILRRMPNFDLFAKDPDAWSVASLENYDEKTDKAVKAAVFDGDILRANTDPEIKSASDALAVTLNNTGKVDMEDIARRLNMSEDEAVKALGDEIFLDPNGDRYRIRSDYLSGDVVGKLANARAAAESDSRYARNVAELEKVQPAPLTRDQIFVPFGAPWAPAEIYNDFIKQKLHGQRADVYMNPATKKWAMVDAHRSYFPESAEALWAIKRKPLSVVIPAALNGQTLTVTDPVYGGGTVVNKQATEDVNERIKALRVAFQGDVETGAEGWVWQDDARATKLEAIYNQNYNRLVRTVYDGSHMTFPGMASHFRNAKGELQPLMLHPHQKHAIWRIIQSGNTLIDHVVGAGKTLVMIAAGMEMKRLGMIQRPVYAVPNHMLEQFSREFLQAYPGAKLFITDKDAMSADRRKELGARISSENFDAVIMRHSVFERIPLTPETYQEFVDEQLEELEQLIRENKGDRATVKGIQEAKKALNTKMQKLLAKSKKDQGVAFEELGIDHIFVDEAHLFKNLVLSTRHQRIKGIKPDGSQRATDLFMKIRQLEKSNPGRSAVFATGTPISNSVAEAYTMQRYLQMATLKEYGVDHFDAWASTFGLIDTVLELAPNGRKFQENVGFYYFVNIPEMVALYSRIADTQTAEMLDLPRPKLAGGGIKIIKGELSEYEEGMVQELLRREERIRNKEVEKHEDNHLWVGTDGYKMTTDARLLDANAPFNPRGKTALAVENISRLYREAKEPGLAQMVFLDQGIPGSKPAPKRERATDKNRPEEEQGLIDYIRDSLREEEGEEVVGETTDPTEINGGLLAGSGFNLYHDLRERLVGAGVARNHIAFIHDATSDEKKARLFEKVREGQVRVIIGTSAKMGVGTNVQKRLKAMHHIDAPWRPADLAQRDGRILRQGNLNDEVEIYRYVMERSWDTQRWQTLEKKANFIDQIRTGDPSVRTAQDIGDTLPEAGMMKAAASGNPLILEHAELTKKIKVLESAKKSHARVSASAMQELQKNLSTQKWLEGLRDDREVDAKLVTDLSGDKFKLTLSLPKPVEYDNRTEAGTALLDYLKNWMKDFYSSKSQEREIGEMSGLTMLATIERSRDGHNVRIALKGKAYHGDTYDWFVINDETSPVALMQRYERILKQILPNLAHTKDYLARTKEDEPRLIAAAKATAFPRQTQLNEAVRRKAEIESTMDADADQPSMAVKAKAEAAWEAFREDNYREPSPKLLPHYVALETARDSATAWESALNGLRLDQSLTSHDMADLAALMGLKSPTGAIKSVNFNLIASSREPGPLASMLAASADVAMPDLRALSEHLTPDDQLPVHNTQGILRGLRTQGTYAFPAEDVARAHDLIKEVTAPYGANGPEVYVATSVQMAKDGAITVAYTKADGSKVTLAEREALLLGAVAHLHTPTKRIYVNRIPAPGEPVGFMRGILIEELGHWLRLAGGFAPGGRFEVDFFRLVGHAHKLQILDMPIGDFAELTGNYHLPVDSTSTFRQVYNRIYRGDPRRGELLNQEAAFALARLWYGLREKRDPRLKYFEPVRQQLEKLFIGAYADNTPMGDIRVPISMRSAAERFMPPKGQQSLLSTAGGAPETKGLVEIIADLKQALGMQAASRQGFETFGVRGAQSGRRRFFPTRKNVAGQYEADRGIERHRIATDIETIAHEGGHRLEAVFGDKLAGLKDANRAELEPMAYAGAADKLREGFAEFFRQYITDPDTARTAAPNFFRHFEDFLDAEKPAMLAEFDNLQRAQVVKDYQKYRRATALERAIADTSSHVDRATTRGFKDWTHDALINDTVSGFAAKTWHAFIDRDNPYYMITRGLLKTADVNKVTDKDGLPISLATHENPYKLARSLTDSYKTATAWIQQGMPNYRHQITYWRASITDPTTGITTHKDFNDEVSAREFAGSTNSPVHIEKQAVPTDHRSASLWDGLNTAMGKDWTEQGLKSFGAYLISRRAVEEWKNWNAKQARMAKLRANIDATVNLIAKEAKPLRNQKDMLTRRKNEMIRTDALLRENKLREQRQLRMEEDEANYQQFAGASLSKERATRMAVERRHDALVKVKALRDKAQDDYEKALDDEHKEVEYKKYAPGKSYVQRINTSQRIRTIRANVNEAMRRIEDLDAQRDDIEEELDALAREQQGHLTPEERAKSKGRISMQSKEADHARGRIDRLEERRRVVLADIERLTSAVETHEEYIESLKDTRDRMREDLQTTKERGITANPTRGSQADHEDVVMTAEAKYPGYRQAAEMVYDFLWQATMHDYQAGIISKETMEARLAKRSYYVPHARDMSDLAIFNARKSKMTGTLKTLRGEHTYRGSQRSIYNPIEIILDQVYHRAALTHMNETLVAMANLADQAGHGSAEIVQRVNRAAVVDLDANGVNLITNQLTARGWDATDAADMANRIAYDMGDMQAFLSWKPETNLAQPLRLPFFENGQRNYLELHDPAWARAMFEGLNAVGSDMRTIWGDLMQGASVLIQSTVWSNLAFSTRHAIRTMFAAWMQTGSALNPKTWPLVNTMVGGYHWATNSELARLYQEVAGSQGGMNKSMLADANARMSALELKEKGIKFSGKIMLPATLLGGAVGFVALGPVGAAIGGFTGAATHRGVAGALTAKSVGQGVGKFFRRTAETLAGFSDVVEVSTRYGVAAEAYKAALRNNPALTPYQAAQEMAYVARSIFDGSKKGSQMVQLIRQVPFMNAHIQHVTSSLEKFFARHDRGLGIDPAKLLLAQGVAGLGLGATVGELAGAAAVFGVPILAMTAMQQSELMRQALRPWFKASHGVKYQHAGPLSKNERAALADSAKMWGNFALYSLMLLGLEYSYMPLGSSMNTPETLQLRQEHDMVSAQFRDQWVPVRIGDTWIRFPKAFQLGVGHTILKAALDAQIKGDPRLFERVKEGLYDTMAPPFMPQAFRLYFDIRDNRDSFRERPIVPEHMQNLPPEQQFSEYTSHLARWISHTINADSTVKRGAESVASTIFGTRHFKVSPLIVDHAISTSLGYWGRDAQLASEFARKGGVPYDDIRSYPMVGSLVSQFHLDPYKQSEAMSLYWRKIADKANGYPQASGGYKQFIAQDDASGANTFLASLPPEQRTYALFDAQNDQAARLLHPINRGAEIMKIVNQMTREVHAHDLRNTQSGSITSGIPIGPDKGFEVTTALQHIAAIEMHNTFLYLGDPAMTGSKPMEVEPMLELLKVASPEAYQEFTWRLFRKHVPSWERVTTQFPMRAAGLNDAWQRQTDAVVSRIVGQKQPKFTRGDGPR